MNQRFFVLPLLRIYALPERVIFISELERPLQSENRLIETREVTNYFSSSEGGLSLYNY